MKKPLKQAATRKFGEGVPQVDRILELEVGVESIVIGTLYKEMKVSCADETASEYAPVLPVAGHTRTCGATADIRAHTHRWLRMVCAYTYTVHVATAARRFS